MHGYIIQNCGVMTKMKCFMKENKELLQRYSQFFQVEIELLFVTHS